MFQNKETFFRSTLLSNQSRQAVNMALIQTSQRGIHIAIKKNSTGTQDIQVTRDTWRTFEDILASGVVYLDLVTRRWCSRFPLCVISNCIV